MAEKPEADLTIPFSVLYKPRYQGEFYKLPSDTLKYWADMGIEIGRCLGEGSFAAAYEGRYGKDAKVPTGKENLRDKEFAVKVIHVGYHPYVPGAPNKDKIDDETAKEVAIANRQDIIHANIIKFHFTAESPANANPPEHVMIFMEKCMFPLQDLMNYMIRNRVKAPPPNGIKWMSGILQALKHLHSIHLVHSDIHSYNIFVSGDCQQQIGNDFRYRNIDLKIADFGKAVDMTQESDENKNVRKSREMENICLAMINISAQIGFDDEVRKQVIGLLNEVYQRKSSIDSLLESQLFRPNQQLEDWTIFITQ